MSLGNNISCQCVVGYACINETLGRIKPKAKAVMVNRSMTKKTFLQKGIPYAGELALLNLIDLAKIVRWNFEHGIYLYRMSSDMFPWASEYTLDQLPQFKQIHQQLQNIGLMAQEFEQRLTFHPGQFNVLVSPQEQVVKNTIKELEFHASIMDHMGLPRSRYAKINIHLGGAYGDKISAMQRFCKNFALLSESVRSRLTIENDDKKAMYTVQDLYDGIYVHLEVPIVFDTLHHACNPGMLSEREAFLLAFSTWQHQEPYVDPIIHVSETRRLQDPNALMHAHADYITNCVNTYDKKVAIMIEAKAKELAVEKYKSLCCKG